MKLFKFFLLFIMFVFFYSCTSVKEGFSNNKKNNSDEFLVEKKSPLIMPPNYNELPIPKENIEENDKNIKGLINNKTEIIEENTEVDNSDFEKSLLKKIKKNN